MSKNNEADEPAVEQPLAPLWHDEVYRFIEQCRDSAFQEERDLAVEYFESCLLALTLCSLLGVPHPADLTGSIAKATSRGIVHKPGPQQQAFHCSGAGGLARDASRPGATGTRRFKLAACGAIGWLATWHF